MGRLGVREDRTIPSPKIYQATEDASTAAHAAPIGETFTDTGTYVRKVMTSSWWIKNTPARTSRRALLIEDNTLPSDYGAFVFFQTSGRPVITLTRHEVFGGVAMLNPWIILHELAHVMTYRVDEGRHGRPFLYNYLKIVNHKLSPAHAEALRVACKSNGVRMDYRLIL